MQNKTKLSWCSGLLGHSVRLVSSTTLAVGSSSALWLSNLLSANWRRRSARPHQHLDDGTSFGVGAEWCSVQSVSPKHKPAENPSRRRRNGPLRDLTIMLMPMLLMMIHWRTVVAPQCVSRYSCLPTVELRSIASLSLIATPGLYYYHYLWGASDEIEMQTNRKLEYGNRFSS